MHDNYCTQSVLGSSPLLHVYPSEGHPVHIQFITVICAAISLYSYTKRECVISTLQYIVFLLHELCPFVSVQKDEPSQAQVGMWVYIPRPHLVN